MDALVVVLDAVRYTDRALVGGKAASLGMLRDAGFPVPPGICITTTAFRRAITPLRPKIQQALTDADLHDPAGISAVAGALEHILSDLTVPNTLVTAVNAALREHLDAWTSLAVRSSATDEDSVTASFAGHYATVLGVQDDDALWAAIRTCWHSCFSAAALATRLHAQLPLDASAMAILLQPMVPAECAGVCLSVDPVQQRSDRLLVNASWGLGSGVVEGTVATDTAVIRRADFQIEHYQARYKPDQVILAPQGGTQSIPVPDDQQQAACLPEAWAKRVAQFGFATELFLGAPQELEWAIADGQIWVLQSRPITGPLPAPAQRADVPVTWTSEEERREVWWLDQATKATPPLPLEHELTDTLNRGYAEAERFKGAAHYWQRKLVCGRSYYGATAYDLHTGDQRIRQAAIADLIQRLRANDMTLWEYWGPEIITATERLRTFDLASADGPALATHLEDSLGALRRHWMLHPLINIWPTPPDPLHAAYTAMTGQKGATVEEAVAKLLEGEETALTRLIDGLYALAETARATPPIAELLGTMPLDVDAQLAILPAAAPFWRQLQDFLQIYGDRVGHGFGSVTTWRSPTWKEQPRLVLELVVRYLDPQVEAPATRRGRARQARDAEVEALCHAGANAAAVTEFRRWLPYARRVAAALEEHNHYIDQLAQGQLRGAICAAGTWLAQHKIIANRDDIYWLESKEILASLRAAAPRALHATIGARRSEYAVWETFEYPAFLGIPPAELEPRPPNQNVRLTPPLDDARLVVGQGASPGRHRGRARVVDMTRSVPDVVPGEVLVAQNAGPLWTPLFPILGAVVLDQGVLMQHAATVAREYSLPMVIETRTATERIRDGQWVIVDGTAGTVEFVDPQASEHPAGRLP